MILMRMADDHRRRAQSDQARPEANPVAPWGASSGRAGVEDSALAGRMGDLDATPANLACRDEWSKSALQKEPLGG
jgi:hypothetical protein